MNKGSEAAGINEDKLKAAVHSEVPSQDQNDKVSSDSTQSSMEANVSRKTSRQQFRLDKLPPEFDRKLDELSRALQLTRPEAVLRAIEIAHELISIQGLGSTAFLSIDTKLNAIMAELEELKNG